MITGAHVSVAGGLVNAIDEAERLAINVFAIFTKNQRQWTPKPLSEEAIEEWKDGLQSHEFDYICSHDSYLINLCAPNPENLVKSLNSMTDELQRAEALGLSHVIAHPGSHLKEGEEWGINKIADSINEVHRRAPGLGAKIALEITAGQGTNLGYNFEQIAKMIELTRENERLSVCFDTCHAHAAGYNLLSQESYDQVWSEFDKIIGLDRLALFHLNDSKNDLGSRKDRHEKIGKGLMGLEPFRFLINDKRFKYTPAILETPEGDGGYAEDLKTLTDLVE